MSPPDLIVDNTWRDFKAARSARADTLGDGGGGNPPNDDMEHRVSSLEKNFEKIDAKLDKIIATSSDLNIELEKRFGGFAEKLASIDAKLDAKAAATDLATVKGRVESLPTTWQMITLVFGILGGAFLILKFGLPTGH